MRVLFVDDEPNILSGLRRILHPLRNEWDMHFFDSGEKALAALEDSACDVIISDMKMPGMNGADLLSAVQARYPDSIRIALSGETDAHMIYRCVQHAHQYLAKPCDIDILTDTVKRACSLREFVKDDDLKRTLSNMGSLPSLPDAYTDIMQELQSEDPSLDRIGKIIESDVAMSAKLLQIVNSAFFGLVRHVSSPAEAAMFLGVDTIKSLVLTTGVFSQFDTEKIDAAAITAIWTRSMRVGAVAKQIMSQQSSDKLLADYAMMGGIMADVGKLVIAANFPEKFTAIGAQSAVGDELDVEKKELGNSHTEIGAYLLSLWGLPNPVVECVAYHHTPSECVEQSFVPLTAVHIATAVVDAGDSDQPRGLDKEYVARLGVAEKIPGWIEKNRELDEQQGGEDE